MKTACIYGCLLFSFSHSLAQEAGENTLFKKRQCFIHVYPSAAIAGDLAIGVEYVLTKKIANEVSSNVKLFQTNFYEYNQGFRFDYLFKYFIYNRTRFALSANLALAYKNIYFENEQINYYYVSESSNQSDQLYESILEDRRHQDFGLGLGLSATYKVYKRFFIGADVIMNVSHYTITNHYKDLIYRDPYALGSNQKSVPSTSIITNSSPSLAPLLRLKLSVLITK